MPKCSIQVGDLWAFTASCTATRADASLPLPLHVGKTLWQEKGKGGGAADFSCRLIFLLMLPRSEVSCDCPETKAAARKGLGFVSL